MSKIYKDAIEKVAKLSNREFRSAQQFLLDTMRLQGGKSSIKDIGKKFEDAKKLFPNQKQINGNLNRVRQLTNGSVTDLLGNTVKYTKPEAIKKVWNKTDPRMINYNINQEKIVGTEDALNLIRQEKNKLSAKPAILFNDNNKTELITEDKIPKYMPQKDRNRVLGFSKIFNSLKGEKLNNSTNIYRPFTHTVRARIKNLPSTMHELGHASRPVNLKVFKNQEVFLNQALKHPVGTKSYVDSVRNFLQEGPAADIRNFDKRNQDEYYSFLQRSFFGGKKPNRNSRTLGRKFKVLWDKAKNNEDLREELLANAKSYNSIYDKFGQDVADKHLGAQLKSMLSYTNLERKGIGNDIISSVAKNPIKDKKGAKNTTRLNLDYINRNS